MRLIFCLLVILQLFQSCKRDEPIVLPPETPGGMATGEGVFIINEGNFGWGNAEVSYYRFSDKMVFHNLFSSANDRPLGDVAQSMTIINGRGYIVVNNSGKIEVVNTSDFSSVGTINGFTSPRYCLRSGTQKMYVSDLYADEISIVDLSSNTITGTIPFAGWSEQMVNANQKVYIGNNQSAEIIIVDPSSNMVTDTIITSNYCNSMVTDKNGKIWALCAGMTGANAVLHCIDPLSDSIAASVVFPAGQSPWRLKINGSGDQLYYLNNGVYSFPVTSVSLSPSPIVPAGTSVFYSLGIDPSTNDIYIGDAIDYVQNGIVYCYDMNGVLKDQFAAGIIPGDFVFP